MNFHLQAWRLRIQLSAVKTVPAPTKERMLGGTLAAIPSRCASVPCH